MNIKDAVLNRLESNRGIYISGASVAAELGVSRQTVYKAVTMLKSEGYVIYALNNRGYMLDRGCDKISASFIADLTGVPVYAYESVTSTNTVAAKLLRDSGECVVASNCQTEGRKKDGGNFYSPKDKGVYFSIAVKTEISLDSVDKLREICGKACAEVITETCGKPARTVNIDEVYIGAKKVCGILIECTFNAAAKTLESAIIGIGIYTSETCFADSELGSVFPEDTRNKIIAKVYNKIISEMKKVG